MTNEKNGPNGLVKWDLGSGNPNEGESRPTGWLFQDVDSSIKGIDLVCNLLDIDEHLDKNSVDEFRLSHVWEHFTIEDGKKLIKKLHKLLKVDGILTVIVPNFKWHSQLCLSGHENEAIYYCFGGQKDEWDLHKTGFTASIVKERLTEAGFALISLNDESSITCIAKKI